MILFGFAGKQELENIKIGNKIIFIFILSIISCKKDNLNSNAILNSVYDNFLLTFEVLITQNQLNNSVIYCIYKKNKTHPSLKVKINLNDVSYIFDGKDSINISPIGVKEYEIDGKFFSIYGFQFMGDKFAIGFFWNEDLGLINLVGYKDGSISHYLSYPKNPEKTKLIAQLNMLLIRDKSFYYHRRYYVAPPPPPPLPPPPTYLFDSTGNEF